MQRASFSIEPRPHKHFKNLHNVYTYTDDVGDIGGGGLVHSVVHILFTPLLLREWTRVCGSAGVRRRSRTRARVSRSLAIHARTNKRLAGCDVMCVRVSVCVCMCECGFPGADAAGAHVQYSKCWR